MLKINRRNTTLMALLLMLSLSLVGVGCSQETSSDNIHRKQSFNYDWKFQLGDSISMKLADYNDSDWRKLDLPHDWSIEGKPKLDNPSGNDGGYYPTGTGWYRKTFQVPKSWDGKKVSVYFEGVYMNSEVFINGNLIGKQPYGYTSFEYDLSPYLHFGKENTMAVRVDNSQQKNSRWYTGSGIYRNVWLFVKNPVNIPNWGVAISTPKVTGNSAEVQIKTRIKNTTNKLQNLKIKVKILNAKNTVSEDEKDLELRPKEDIEIAQLVTVNNPELWSPDNPNLYEAKININKDGKTIDALTKNFGIRTLNFSVENGFQLNGKKILINGGCVHHDNGILGAAAYDAAEVRKVALLKKAGFNAVRTSHNPPSEAFLNACDSLGLMVVDEAFDGWREMKSVLTPIKHDYSTLFDTWWKHDLSSMVLRDRNHPSIIMWSIGNEIIERTKPEAVETAKMLSAAVKEIDTTRPVTSAMTTWGQGWDIFDPLMAAHDIAGYNYQLFEAESDHERVPSRIIVNTESYPKNAFFIWNLVQKHNYILGDFVWTAMDYLGESGIGRYYYSPGEPDGEHWQKDLFPWHGAYCGDIDFTGWRKPISHYRSMLYNDNEKLYMAVREPNPKNSEIKTTMWAVWPTWESWNWPGYEGQDLQVEVYSKYPQVRLYLNDTLINEKEVNQGTEFKTIFNVPYQEGELKAVGLKNGKKVETVILRSADKASNITLQADRKTIQADGQDLSFITVEITDDRGILQPNASNLLQFKVSGPGTIVGVGNADLKDTDSYSGTSFRAWKGRALVVVKSTNEPGEIILNVTSKDLKDSKIQIKTIAK